ISYANIFVPAEKSWRPEEGIGEWRISILAGRPSCGGPSAEDLRSAVLDVHGRHGAGTSPSGWAQSEPRGPELRRRDPYRPNRRIARRPAVRRSSWRFRREKGTWRRLSLPQRVGRRARRHIPAQPESSGWGYQEVLRRSELPRRPSLAVPLDRECTVS